MKRDALIREIRKAARAAGKDMELVRQGKHEVWRVGKTTVPIPRHNEIGPKMAFVIRADLESELGKRWWK